MTFANLFEVPQTGNRIDIIYMRGRRNDITTKTVNWWESHGWQVKLWNNAGNKLARGHNIILDDWRQSDRELLIMCHDDITLYPHRYLTADWLKKPIPGLYTVNSNMMMHHQKLNSSGWDDGQHHWTDTDEICKLFVVNDKTVPRFDEQVLTCEDLEWAWACYHAGFRPQRLNTVFLR